jgi:hypothetical protein
VSVCQSVGDSVRKGFPDEWTHVRAHNSSPESTCIVWLDCIRAEVEKLREKLKKDVTQLLQLDKKTSVINENTGKAMLGSTLVVPEFGYEPSWVLFSGVALTRFETRA